MLRLSLTAANALVGRNSTATVSVVGSLRCPVQHFSCRPCLTFRAGTSHQLHTLSSHGGLRRAPSVAASPQDGIVTTACDPSIYKGLSLIIILQECIRRAYGRPLLEVSDPLALPAQLDSLPCCVLLLAPTPAPLPNAAGPSPAGSTYGPAPGFPADECMPQSIDPGAPGANRGSDTRGSSDSSSGCASVGSSVGVQYVNRAAAEALKVAGVRGAAHLATSASTATTSSSSSSSGGGASSWRAESGAVPQRVNWRLLERDPVGGELVRAVLAKHGAPQRGELHCLTLRTAASPEVSVEGVAPTITCPEALVMPLMSPNGACAGAALLFDRWQVRGSEGEVLLEGRPLVPEIPPGSQPREEDLLELQEAVRSQADDVRALKSQQGRTNQDPLVAEAVAALQRLKADLELQQRLQKAFSAEPGVVGRLLQAAE